MLNRIVEFFDVSSICFKPYLTDRRQPPRPKHLQQEDFNQNYDYGIIFIDVFHDISEKKIHCIGAPLYHMTDLISSKNISCLPKFNFLNKKNYNNTKLQIKELDRVSHTTIFYNNWLKPEFLQFNIYGTINVNIINNNHSNLLTNKRVVLFKNKDNKFRWIKDYCDYYHKIHQADCVLIYDSSEEYSSLELLEYLKHNTNISIIVIRWPVPYGPTKFKDSSWDSDYSLYSMFEHAKYRFLRFAKSVLYVDIDELVVCKNNRSVFEVVENQEEYFNTPIYFNGEWIINTTLKDDYSFKDFYYIDKTKNKAVVKWCLGLNRSKYLLNDEVQWRVHDHYDHMSQISLRRELNSEIETRHFIAITTGWRSKTRLENTPPLEVNLLEDEIIISKYKLLGWL
ncbi:hypothetical protein ACW738_000131 [Campylobacter coli]|uniref:hypothetical protein n=1 Tax=Campylobacter coli TaxID=195 RepID=UPI00092FA857|nr:hypothetical protein [Campylobacter coli]ECK7661733.1 hypothetical protein [Campylobacter jejuni]EAI5093141.1 hypothetical protein [Campylobacter coli]EAK7761947.1 hypothetical protein [Campylobacter coli]EAK8167739.1 hypothetical protein [Campylobacter coli]EAK8353037.1 hypothetical protein [Campylobacter coli]